MIVSSKNNRRKPVCSVCIANYNGENVLADCLNSVYSQQGAPSFEVIVHDDASTDDSVKLLLEHYPKAIVIKSKENVGFCISNNRMVERASGEFILLLNNDAALNEDALATLHDHALKQKLKGILTLPQYDWQTGDLVDCGCFLDPFYNPIPNLSTDCIDVAMVIGACLWIPKRLWIALGGFPDWMESIAEDLFLCSLARLYGYPVQVTQSSGYRHWQGLSFSGRGSENLRMVSTYRRRILSERNKTYTMVVASPSTIAPILILCHMITIILEGAIISLFTSNLLLFINIYLQLPLRVWKKYRLLSNLRKEIQQNRMISDHAYLSVFRCVPWKLRLLFRFGMPKVR